MHLSCISIQPVDNRKVHHRWTSFCNEASAPRLPLKSDCTGRNGGQNESDCLAKSHSKVQPGFIRGFSSLKLADECG